jgi:DNA primase large subunit
MDSDKFEKNYSYNIRHMYGKEGKQSDYKGWSCNKVINLVTPG